MFVERTCKECGSKVTMVRCDKCGEEVVRRYANSVDVAGPTEAMADKGHETARFVTKLFCSFGCLKEYVAGSTIESYIAD